MEITKGKIVKFGFSVFAFMLMWGSFFVVQEGYVGVVKRTGQVIKQEVAGFHLKLPFLDSVEHIEVRTRIASGELAGATLEQMPITTKVSVNWTVERESVSDLYKQYGSLSQFHQRILAPRIKAEVKNVLPKFTAEKLVNSRSDAVRLIQANLIESLSEFPVTIDSFQLENISLPEKYLQSIETKQTEKNLADAEKHKLERQRLEALREVNIADAKSQGILKVAKSEAEAIKLKGYAEAHAIEAKGKALRDNPLIVKLTEAQQWDGKLPTQLWNSGGSANGVVPILDVAK